MILQDQLNREIHLEKIPTRIISVVPSITELLFYLGLREEVVGITKFCVHPEEWFRTKQRVGGTKQLKIDLIKSLQPDLIIANKEENTQSDIDALAEFTSVYLSDIKTIDDAYKMIADIGELTNKNPEAEKLITDLKTAFNNSKQRTRNSKPKALYLIWRDPYMIAGGDTFISEMMNQAGFENVAAYLNRYPSVSIEEIKNLNSEILLLSSEPFPFKQKHIDEMQKIFPNQKIILVDGELFSWYGSRMKLAPDYFRRMQQQLANSI
ncbi:MAG: helical backbone metal receptor [Bacteroidota bacterium]